MLPSSPVLSCRTYLARQMVFCSGEGWLVSKRRDVYIKDPFWAYHRVLGCRGLEATHSHDKSWISILAIAAYESSTIQTAIIATLVTAAAACGHRPSGRRTSVVYLLPSRPAELSRHADLLRTDKYLSPSDTRWPARI